MAYDIARIRRVMKQIEAEPETLNMGDWAFRASCGTTMCLAGHVVIDEGLELNWRVDLYGQMVASRLTDGRAVSAVAAKLLGLSEGEAEALFLSVWIDTPAQLWERIAEVTDGAVTEYDRA